MIEGHRTTCKQLQPLTQQQTLVPVLNIKCTKKYSRGRAKCVWQVMMSSTVTHFAYSTQLVHLEPRELMANLFCQQRAPHGKQHQRNWLLRACIFLSPSVWLAWSQLVYMSWNMQGIGHQHHVVWETLRTGWAFNPPTLLQLFPLFFVSVCTVPRN